MAATFEYMCPNLKYPVGDLKELTKIVKKEEVVRGNIEKKEMLDFLFNASNGSNIFNTKKLYSELSPKSAKILENIGYFQETEVSKIMKMDKMLNRRYWNKQLKNNNLFELF